MGANMIVALCRAPRKSKNSYINENDLFDGRLRRDLETRAKTLSPDDVLMAIEASDLVDEATETFDKKFEEPDAHNTRPEEFFTWQVEWYKNQIWERFVLLINSPWRDVACIYIQTQMWWITGGLSGGDSPTEAFDIVREWSFIDSILKQPLRTTRGKATAL
jgi:hypothetical protein